MSDQTRLAELHRYRAALIECAVIAGVDVSDGVPNWPLRQLEVWAVQAVQQLRDDYDGLLTDEADSE